MEKNLYEIAKILDAGALAACAGKKSWLSYEKEWNNSISHPVGLFTSEIVNGLKK
jgi:type IV secretory pathway protease TraF